MNDSVSPDSDPTCVEPILVGGDSLRWLDRFTRSRWILPTLLLAALLPRTVMAIKSASVCDDGFYYFAVAAQLQRGETNEALSYLNVNIFPPLLLLLHSLGLSWEVAGKVWSVTASTLLVLPAYGWMRRLFDARVAATAVFFYAVHPEIIELSTEPVREPTLWLFAMLTLYCGRRASEELHIGWFALAGLSFACSAYTRTEGVLLMIPLVCGCANAWRKQQGYRLRPLAGLAVVMLVVPGALFAFNVTVLRNHSEWEWGRLGRFNEGLVWAQSTVQRIFASDDAAADTVKALPLKSEHSRRRFALPIATRVQRFSLKLVEAFCPQNLLLVLLGLVVWRRLLRDPERLALLLTSAGICLAVWIVMWKVGVSSSRYFHIVFLLLVPFEAVVVLFCYGRIAGWLGRFHLSRRTQIALVGGFLFATTTAGWVDALTSRHTHRQSDIVLGTWLRPYVQAGHPVYSSARAIRVAYYASGTLPDVVLKRHFMRAYADRLGSEPPGVVVLSNVDLAENKQDWRESAEQMGMVEVTPDRLDNAQLHLYVLLVRKDLAEAVRVRQAAHASDSILHWRL